MFERDICLFSASCMMNSIQFEIAMEAEKDSELWVIPPETNKKLMEQFAPLSLSFSYRSIPQAVAFSIRHWSLVTAS